MKTVIATTHFLGSNNEGMWKQGESREVDADRAAKLLKVGLVSEADEKTGETEASQGAEVSPAPAPDPAKREKKPTKVKLETK